MSQDWLPTKMGCKFANAAQGSVLDILKEEDDGTASIASLVTDLRKAVKTTRA